MNNNISNEYLTKAIDELVNTLGVKEEPSAMELLKLIRIKDINQCMKNIAEHLGLPIALKLSYVPDDYVPDVCKFQSKELSRTDGKGRGIEFITAQVLIPATLPSYGTSALINYPINVMVSENCHEQPETLISVMAHELSHILLHSLRHPQMDNEIYTDIVPIIFGFSKIIEKGRKVIETNTDGIITRTTTTSFGYLTDNQFIFASNKINNILGKRRSEKSIVLNMISVLDKSVKVVLKKLFIFRKLRDYLCENRYKKIKKRDGYKIVSFYSPDYTYNMESVIRDSKNAVREARMFCIDRNHYTNTTITMFNKHNNELSLLVEQINSQLSLIKDDVNVLKRNVGILYRYKIAKQAKQYVDLE